MADLNLTRDGELRVVQAEANTDEGTEFLDSYMPSGHEYTVVDSGRILIPMDAEPEFLALVRERGLTVESETVR